MPLSISSSLPTVLIRKSQFEAHSLTRLDLDSLFNLTDVEFRIEDDLIAIGPLPHDDALPQMVTYLEAKGLAYYEDFFELSGNWPEWLSLYARAGVLK